MMKKNTKIALAVVALVVAVAALFTAYFLNRPQTQEGSKAFTVTVVHADGSSKEFSYRTDEEYVGKVLVSEGLISGEEGPYGLYIQVVDGETAIYEENGAYWAFYENGAYATTGIDLTPITDGQNYSLVYTVG